MLRIQVALRAGLDDKVVAFDVMNVMIDLNHLPDSWSAFNWSELDKQISLLDPSRLVFGCASRGHMLMFGAEVVDVLMPRACARDSVRYAVLYNGWWHKASRDSDVLQGMLTSLVPCTSVGLWLHMNRAKNEDVTGSIQRLTCQSLWLDTFQFATRDFAYPQKTLILM